jgi:hypothetical protein
MVVGFGCFHNSNNATIPMFQRHVVVLAGWVHPTAPQGRHFIHRSTP